MPKKFSYVFLLIPGVVIILLFTIVPLIIITIISFSDYVGARGFVMNFTTESYIRLMSTTHYHYLILTTLKIASLVTLLSFVIGFPFAYAVAFKIKSFTLRLLILLFLLQIFWIDYSIRIMGWWPILGYNGVINYFLVLLGVFSEPSDQLIFSESSAIMAMTQSYMLFMVLAIALSLFKIDVGLYGAAQSLGANRFQSFYHITLKMSLPGIIIGCIFVFAMSVADFATPRLIGGLSVPVIGLSIISLAGRLEWPLASALAVFLVAITLGLVYIMLKMVNIKKFIF